MMQTIEGSFTPLPVAQQYHEGVALYTAEQMCAFAKDVSAKRSAPQPNSLLAPKPPNQTLPVGQASNMPGTDGFTMVCFKASDVPAGTDLYALPAPAEDPDIYLIDWVRHRFLTKACIQSSDRVNEAFVESAEILMGYAEAGIEMTDEQIVEVWNGMPGGHEAFMKSWGFIQFARAILAAGAKP